MMMFNVQLLQFHIMTLNKLLTYVTARAFANKKYNLVLALWLRK